MNPPPWLLTSGPWGNKSEIGRRSLHRLGETAAFLQTPGAIDLLAETIRNCPQKKSSADWGAALAREILLFDSLRPDLIGPLFHAISPLGFFLVPFAGGPPIETIFDIGVSVAASLIPLQANGGKGAVFGQIWVVRSPIIAASRAPEITRQRLVEGAPAKGSGMETLIVVTDDEAPERIEGRSWELGAHLAALACDGLARGDSEPALALARDWIVTGAVDPESEDVLQVGMRGKLALADTTPRRNWLLPASNQATIPPEFESKTAGRLHYSIDTGSAWSQITGDGFASGSDFFWDKKPLSGVDEFHCLVSNAQGPMLAGFLWSQPKKIVLWTSKFMAGKAAQLKSACEKLRITHLTSLGGEGAVVIKPVDDTNLEEIRASFLAHPALGRGGANPVAFNITGGNLLMRLAIMDLARLRPQIHLVYRPEGRKNLEFVAISHPFLQPVQARVLPLSPGNSKETSWAEGLLNLTLPYDEPERWAGVLLDAVASVEEHPEATPFQTLQPV